MSIEIFFHSYQPIHSTFHLILKMFSNKFYTIVEFLQLLNKLVFMNNYNFTFLRLTSNSELSIFHIENELFSKNLVILNDSNLYFFLKLSAIKISKLFINLILMMSFYKSLITLIMFYYFLPQ